MPLQTRPLSDFLPLVRPHCTMAPRPVIEQYLRLAAIEWCERTRCWREIVDTPIDEQNEAIVAPDYATVHEIEYAFFDTTTPLTPTQFSKFDRQDLSTTDSVGHPCYITQASHNTVSIIPFNAGTLTMSLFLKPRSGTEYGTNPADPLQDALNVVPEHIFVQSAEKVAWGALARLLALPEREVEWADPKRAAYYAARFEEACDAQFNSHIKGQHRARKRTKTHQF